MPFANHGLPVVFGAMALGPSEWIGIIAIGAGALMGVLGKRVVAIIGVIVVVLGLSGLGISLYRGGESNVAAGKQATEKPEINSQGSSQPSGGTQKCVITGGENKGVQIQNCN
jgi:hypothetical protein